MSSKQRRWWSSQERGLGVPWSPERGERTGQGKGIRGKEGEGERGDSHGVAFVVEAPHELLAALGALGAVDLEDLAVDAPAEHHGEDVLEEAEGGDGLAEHQDLLAAIRGLLMGDKGK